MILTEEPKYWFYPDIMGNLKQPESEQLAVEIIRPKGYQSREFTSVVSTREFYENDQPLDEKGNPRTVQKFKSISTDVKIDADYILRTCVGKIKNLSVKIGDKTKDITNGAELAECSAYGIEEIVSAICMEVRSDIPTESKKKTSE